MHISHSQHKPNNFCLQTRIFYSHSGSNLRPQQNWPTAWSKKRTCEHNTWKRWQFIEHYLKGVKFRQVSVLGGCRLGKRCHLFRSEQPVSDKGTLRFGQIIKKNYAKSTIAYHYKMNSALLTCCYLWERSELVPNDFNDTPLYVGFKSVSYYFVLGLFF